MCQSVLGIAGSKKVKVFANQYHGWANILKLSVPSVTYLGEASGCTSKYGSSSGSPSTNWMQCFKEILDFWWYLGKAMQNMKGIKTIKAQTKAGSCCLKIAPRPKLLISEVAWRFSCPTDSKY